MTTWAGLTQTGDVDVDVAERFGVSISDTVTDETNVRFKQCLAVACLEWEKLTGRVYGRTAEEARTETITVYRKTYMHLPTFQSVASVECLNSDGTFETVETDQYTALKLGSGRGEHDTLYHVSGWMPGVYKITAVWGEAEPPESAVFGAIKYATYMYKVQTNPSGVGTHNNLEGGVMIEFERIPGVVYQLMMADKLARSMFPRSN